MDTLYLRSMNGAIFVDRRDQIYGGSCDHWTETMMAKNFEKSFLQCCMIIYHIDNVSLGFKPLSNWTLPTARWTGESNHSTQSQIEFAIFGIFISDPSQEMQTFKLTKKIHL